MTGDALRDCTGYDVELRDGGLGTAAAVVRPRGDAGTGMVIVHSGPSCNLCAVSFDEVERVDVNRRRLVVGPRPVKKTATSVTN